MFEATGKNFQWLCATLVSAEAQLPIVESVFIQRGEIALWVYSTKSGKIKKRMPSQPFDASLSSVLRHFQRGRNWTDSDPVCTALIDETRTPIFLKRGQVPQLALSSIILQEAIADISNLQIYTLRLDRQNGDYTCSFTMKVGETVKKGKSLRAWCKCSAAGKVVLAAVKRITNEVVVSLELQLILSPLGDVLLYGCPLISVQSGILNSEIIHPRRKPPKKDLSRLLTPASLCPKPILLTEESAQMLSESTPQVSSTHTTLPKINILHKHLDFENPHFKEIVALTYARTRPHLLKANIDEIFAEMSHDFLQEKDPSSKPTPLIIPRRSRCMSMKVSLKGGLLPPVFSSLDLSTTSTLEHDDRKRVKLVAKVLRNSEKEDRARKPLENRLNRKRSESISTYSPKRQL